MKIRLMLLHISLKALGRLNDTWALTLGARYAEDEKEALELTGGYAELYASALGGFLPVINLNLLMEWIPVAIPIYQ